MDWPFADINMEMCAHHLSFHYILLDLDRCTALSRTKKLVCTSVQCILFQNWILLQENEFRHPPTKIPDGTLFGGS